MRGWGAPATLGTQAWALSYPRPVLGVKFLHQLTGSLEFQGYLDRRRLCTRSWHLFIRGWWFQQRAGKSQRKRKLF